MNNLKLDAAVSYAKRGWAVIPLHSIRPDGECTCGNYGCHSIGKHPIAALVPNGLINATTNEDVIKEWWNKYPNANIGIVTGSISGFIVLDVDPKHDGFNSLVELERKYGKLPVTLVVETGSRGKHYYLYPPQGFPIRNSAGILGKGLDIRGDGGYVVAPPSLHSSGQQYKLIEADIAGLPLWLEELIVSKPAQEQKNGSDNDDLIPEGERNSRLASIAGSLHHKLSSEALEVALLEENKQRCNPPLDDKEVLNIAKSISKYPKSSYVNSYVPSPIHHEWNATLSNDAYYGLTGKVVKLIEPHTEAPTEFLLIQFLVATGNIIGRYAHYLVGADKHFAKIFTILVGNSSKARKGTSWNCIKSILKKIDEAWSIVTGLSSGEGLIWAVRDPIYETKSIKQNGQVIGYQEVMIDKGVEDKRLLVIEPEFARVFKVLGRDGNTLSPIMRSAYDDGDLCSLTKNSPAKATGAHISFIGHITSIELKKHLQTIEIANGFGNRFLWMYAKRSKLLSNGGELDKVDFSPIIAELKDILEYTKNAERISFDAEAQKYWDAIYTDLSEEKYSISGLLTNRNEAQAIRIAMIYALLDQSDKIKTEHLKAAIAVIKYCEASCDYLFSELNNNPLANQIYSLLQNSKNGLSRTDISNALHRNKGAKEIQEALMILKEQKRVNFHLENTEKRTCEVWFVINEGTNHEE